ncbi:DUF3108 domain-containing protein [Amantichitinum ursilacus]|uniref:DUF3108 domain-containing protein n=1 Tax=Amantichitinum ursilacus TaxID=857265 RepID=A0A0N1JTB1_9NEIS|nr:DUF3108 domain-containing protein [Amantichitinum ursilacus]KPC54061.1 hypothetical protein WG78_05410 [Amantichitinum ursilacus]
MTAPRAHRRWSRSRLLLLGAFVLSLILHVITVSGDLIYAWWTNTPIDLNEKLSKVTHKLEDQSWDDDELPTSLKNVKRPERQTIWLQPKQPLKLAAAPTPVPTPAPTPKPKPRPKPTPTPSPVLAETGTPASSASEVAAVTPTPEPLFTADKASAAAASMMMAAATPIPTVPPAPAPASHPAAASAPDASAVAALANGPLKHKGFPRHAVITYLYRGLPIPARMTWEVENGRYSIRLAAAMFGKSRALSSEGSISSRGLVPEHYTDMRDGKVQNEAVFDWANNVVNMHDGDKHPTGALKPGDQDLLSAPFQFAQQGSRLKDFTFSLASGRKFYQDVPFEIRGQATLRLGGKPVDAVVLHGTFEDRVFDFWLAPQWSNLPVRMVIVLGKDAPIDVVATEVTIEGNTVLEPPIAGIDRPHPPGGTLNR